VLVSDRITSHTPGALATIGRAVNAGALTSQESEPSTCDDDGGLSDNDPDHNSDDDGCSSEDE
jgi:hypothetical protein